MGDMFLGLDSSTQSLSAVLIDLASRTVVGTGAVGFDEDLPSYGTTNGVVRDPDDPGTVHGHPKQWLDALDLLFVRLRDQGAPLGEIRAISGSGQQHGSVYLRHGIEERLAALDPAKGLAANLDGVFSRATAPVWMDSSTSAQCAEIAEAMGGPLAVAEATGSVPFERFTGPQIRKFSQQEPEAYRETARIALVSSFMASVLAGRLAPIDPGDGAGMNLMDIRTRDWHPEALAATAPDLQARLPRLAPSWTVVDRVHRYFAVKHGVNPDARVVAWSGDNPCSVIGLGLVEPGMTAISLGTSDPCFGTMAECRTDPRGEGHVFGSPTGDYMTLICFKNGSLARERVRDAYGLDWAGFSAALHDTPPGNEGRLMLPWFEPEIVPKVLRPGVHRFDLDEADAAANCRAVVEGQMMAMRNHSEWMGARPQRVFATGGASANPEILQVMADVMGCPVHRFEVSNSAALGAALRAAHAHFLAEGTERPWPGVVAGFTDPVPGSEIRPRPEATQVYDYLVMKHAQFERDTLARLGD